MESDLYRNPYLQWLAYAAFFAVLAAIPLSMDDPFLLNQLSVFGVYGMLALSIALCWGFGGILNLGQGIAFGLGAYGMAMTMQMQSQDPETNPIPPFMLNNSVESLPLMWQPFFDTGTGLFLALAVPVAFYVLFGGLMFAARVSGPFFAIMTIAILSAFATLFTDVQRFTNGVNGISPPSALQIGDTVIDPFGSISYWVVFVLLMVTTCGAKLITKSRFGLVTRALQDDPERVRFLGYNVAVYEVFIYAISGLIAAIAGCCFALLNQYVSPAQFDVGFSISIVIWVAIGGRTSLLWAILGAFLIKGAESYAGDAFLNTWILILGGFFILVVRFLPKGLAGLTETLLALAEKRVAKKSVVAKHAEGKA